MHNVPMSNTLAETTDRPAPNDGHGRKHLLGVPQLTALVVGSMVGAGIFALPMNMAQAAAPGPLLIGWGITGVGMLALALTFTLLARLAPHPDGGVYGTARDGSMPKVLATENRHGTPTWSVLLTSIVLQLALVYAAFAGSSYYDIILMAGSMILLPYLLSAGYGVVLAVRNRSLGKAGIGSIVLTLVATVYGLWLIYAGGLGYLLMTALFYAPGVLVYLWAQRERGEHAMKPWEWLVWAVMAAGFVAAVVEGRPVA